MPVGIAKMPDDKTSYTKLPFPKPNEPIPYFVSDRLDAMRSELDGEQVLRLYHALKSLDFGGWTDWFVQNLGKILEFDALTPTQRKKAVLGKADESALLLHHACVVLECLRIRINCHYMQLHDDKDLPPMKDVDYRQLIAFGFVVFERFWVYDTWYHYDTRLQHPFFELDKS